jgi:IS5 family transposase
MKQQTFASLEYNGKKKQTRRERFLGEMEQAVPWSRLLSVIAPHYHKTGQPGGQPKPLETMLRIYLLQQWYGLSDPGMEDALYEIESMRRFVGLNLWDDQLPDETTILNFRHLLERHGLTARMLAEINAHLQEQGVTVSQGTMVDATIVHAPSSTKNREGKRDPEMRQTRKGNQWYFGMKIHVGADVASGAAQSVTVTSSNRADIDELPKLLREEDAVIFGDAGYASDAYKRGARQMGLHWLVNDKGKPKNSQRPGLSARQKKRNRRRSSIRARVEHLFRIIKCQFGFTKVRYKGLAKNRSQVMALMGLANLYLVREQLVG